METVQPEDSRWHDKTLDGRVFECQHCGAEEQAWEADALCEDCGGITKLPIEVMEDFGPSVN